MQVLVDRLTDQLLLGPARPCRFVPQGSLGLAAKAQVGGHPHNGTTVGTDPFLSAASFSVQPGQALAQLAGGLGDPLLVLDQREAHEAVALGAEAHTR